jgi:hypothetical protein
LGQEHDELIIAQADDGVTDEQIVDAQADANAVADRYPNASIAYQIMLTIPVTVASAERSFSKLKLSKSYLRSVMLQDRSNGLAMCRI